MRYTATNSSVNAKGTLKWFVSPPTMPLMTSFLDKRKTTRESAGKFSFEMRAGIHTGPVVAGIVGSKKFQYDIYGDTVNLASRMEAAGEPGKVNISKETYELIKDNAQFMFKARGQLMVKGKGCTDMFYVEQVIEVVAGK